MGPEGTIAGPRITDVHDHPVVLPSNALPRLRVARLFISTTADTDFVDITQCCFDMIERHKPAHGNIVIFTRHTTCGLTINEDEEGYQEDVRTTVERLTPRDRYWAHDDLDRRWQNLTPDERPNGHSHVRSMLVGNPSVTIPIIDGELALGRWQRLFLMRLDGGHEREVILQMFSLDHPEQEEEFHLSVSDEGAQEPEIQR